MTPPYAFRGVLIVTVVVALGVALSVRTDARSGEGPDGEIRLRSIIGGQSFRARGDVFGGGSISTLMGGVNLDLTRAEMEGTSVVVDLNVVMGGIKVRVPREWVVVTEVTPIFGGVRNRTRPPEKDGPAPELTIRGTVVMGGLDITN